MGPYTIMPLPVIVALSIHPPPKAGLGKDPLFDLALPAQFDLGLEDINLTGQIRWHFASELFFPCLSFSHLNISIGIPINLKLIISIG